MNKTISVLFATTIFTAPVFADQLRVVVDIPPVHGIVDGVLGSNASITTLIGSGLDPHNYTMKPSDMANLRAQIEAALPACMIIDPNDHTALAYALAEEYSIKTLEFSQLGEIVEGQNAYLDLMSGAVAAFKTCFQ